MSTKTTRFPPRAKNKKIVKYHRVHAHSNPLADKFFYYPSKPSEMDWKHYYPTFIEGQSKVENLDIGCGYGGLTVALSEKFPDELTLAMEIRDRVVEYVEQRIDKLREENPGKYQNINVIKCNCMKNLPNFFNKGQMKRLFFLFPDPHFKKSNVRRRIISPVLCSEYAYLLREGGIAYTITDVEDLHNWMVSCFDAHPLFERIPDEEAMKDPATPLLFTESEEAKKVDRAKGKKFLAVYRRIAPKTTL